MSDKTYLFELKPPASVDSVLLTTNVGIQTRGTVFCSNQAEINDYISVAMVSNANVLANSSWILYQARAYPGLPITLQQICLGSGDSIYVNSQNGTTAFVFTGISP